MLSIQEQGASIEEFYNKIHKVYSIWICYNVSGPYENTIRCAKFSEHVIEGSAKAFKTEDLDLAQVWVICLGDCEEAEHGSVLRLLDIAFDKDHNMTKAEKMQVFSNEYNINDKVIAKEVEDMNAYVLDYAERYAARAVKMGEERKAKETALMLHAMGMAVEMIAKAVNFDKIIVEKWLKESKS